MAPKPYLTTICRTGTQCPTASEGRDSSRHWVSASALSPLGPSFSFEWDNFSQPQASPKHANITICYTDDNQHWHLSASQAPVGHPVVNGVARCDGANEPTSVMLSNGTLLTLIRTQTGRLWRTLSDDQGTHLQPAVPTQYVTHPLAPSPRPTNRHYSCC